jgi:sporulation protein YlmC with PRC-barrel domain
MGLNIKSSQVIWSELKGRAVVDIINAKNVGRVDDLVLDLQTYQVVGLKFKPGLFSTEQTVPIMAIKGIGDDAITLQLDVSSADPPVEKAFHDLPTLSQVISNQVITEGGQNIGTISNVLLKLQPLEIIGFEINESGIFSKKHTFEKTSQVHFGEKLVIIPDSLLDTFTPSK